jgi:hypothetical protein
MHDDLKVQLREQASCTHVMAPESAVCPTISPQCSITSSLPGVVVMSIAQDMPRGLFRACLTKLHLIN